MVTDKTEEKVAVEELLRISLYRFACSNHSWRWVWTTMPENTSVLTGDLYVQFSVKSSQFYSADARYALTWHVDTIHYTVVLRYRSAGESAGLWLLWLVIIDGQGYFLDSLIISKDNWCHPRLDLKGICIRMRNNIRMFYVSFVPPWYQYLQSFARLRLCLIVGLPHQSFNRQGFWKRHDDKLFWQFFRWLLRSICLCIF